MIGVDKIIGYDKYLADGALGLAYIDENTGDKDIEEDTNFLLKLMVNKEEY